MKARLYGKWPMSQSGPRLAKYRIKNETANKVGVMDKAEDVIGGIFSRSHQRYSPWWRRWELVENTMLHGGEHNVTGHRLRREWSLPTLQSVSSSTMSLSEEHGQRNLTG